MQPPLVSTDDAAGIVILEGIFYGVEAGIVAVNQLYYQEKRNGV